MVLIDTSNDDKRVEEDIYNKVEIHKQANSSELYCKAGWIKGHRSLDYGNHELMDFLKQVT